MASLQEYVRGTVGKVMGEVAKIQQQVQLIQAQHQLILKNQPPPSITQQIDKIKGRRIFFNLSNEQVFTIAENGRQGQPINMSVSQDGAFVMTHYPMAVWTPNAPDNTPNFGLWRPVSAYPLPQQATPPSGAFDLNEDIISISYSFSDGGSQRNFVNETPSGPLLSRPDLLIPLPVPTLFTPNTIISFTPFYERIVFSGGGQDIPTSGRFKVTLPGYRIVNL